MTCVHEISRNKLFEDIDYVLQSIIVKFKYIDYTYTSFVVHCLNMMSMLSHVSI